MARPAKDADKKNKGVGVSLTPLDVAFLNKTYRQGTFSDAVRLAIADARRWQKQLAEVDEHG